MHATYVTSILIAAVEDLRFDRVSVQLLAASKSKRGSPCCGGTTCQHFGKVEIKFHVPIDMRSDF